MRFISLKDLYFLTAIALIRIVSWCSSPRLNQFVVRLIAFAAYRFSRTKRRLSEQTLSEVFDGALREEQRRAIIKGSFSAFWDDLFSSLVPGAEGATPSIDIRGLEHLQRALENGRGVILWESNSFGRRAVAKQVLHAQGVAICQVHGENHIGGFLIGGSSASWICRQVIRRYFEKQERRWVAEIIYLPESNSLAFTRLLLEQLKHNAIICIAADGRLGQKFIPVTLLGRPHFFSTGMISLAKLSGASLLPLFCFQPSRQRTCVVIESPIHLTSDSDRDRGLEHCARQYINLLESYIRRYPDQYRKWPMLNGPKT